MEKIDWLDSEGQKLGVIDRAIAHERGFWHKSVHVWIVDEKDNILLQHRCKQKSFFPSCWDCAFAGHVGTGEDSIDTALREGKEELGLKLSKNDFEFIMAIKDCLTYNDLINNEFVDVYLVRKNINISTLKLQKEEVDDIKWINKDEFFTQIEKERGAFIFHAKEEYSLLKAILNNQEVLV